MTLGGGLLTLLVLSVIGGSASTITGPPPVVVVCRTLVVSVAYTLAPRDEWCRLWWWCLGLLRDERLMLSERYSTGGPMFAQHE